MALYYGTTYHMNWQIYLFSQQKLQGESLILASAGYVNRMCVVQDLFKQAGILQIRTAADFFFRLVTKLITLLRSKIFHCLKNVRIRSYSGPYFSGLEYGPDLI